MKDRGAWCATVHEAAKSWTWLGDWATLLGEDRQACGLWILDSGPVFTLPSSTVTQETAELMESALEGCCGGERDARPSKVQGSTFPWWRVRASTLAARMAVQGPDMKEQNLGFCKTCPRTAFPSRKLLQSSWHWTAGEMLRSAQRREGKEAREGVSPT